MPRDYLTLPLDAIRRRDRAVDDESWMRAFLHEAPYGVLATQHDGQPFINSNLFVYDEEEHALFTHTARVGRTQAVVAAGDDEAGACVCFSAFEMGRLLPADAALEFSVEYAGGVAFGRAHLLHRHDEARRALELLLDKYAPHLERGRDYRGITDAELDRTAVYRIDIEHWTGKRKAAPADFPGAYLYAAVRQHDSTA